MKQSSLESEHVQIPLNPPLPKGEMMVIVDTVGVPPYCSPLWQRGARGDLRAFRFHLSMFNRTGRNFVGWISLRIHHNAQCHPYSRWMRCRLSTLLFLLFSTSIQTSFATDFDFTLNKRSVPEKIQESKLFRSKNWQPEPVKIVRKAAPPPPPVVEAPPPPPPPPSAPPLPYVFIGRMMEGSQLLLFLSNNGQSYVVKQKDVLDNTWQVDKITATEAVLTYLPYKLSQTLVFNSNAIGSAAWQKLTPEAR